MRVCVTGGCGFIGSHFVEAAINADHEVIVIDNLSKGTKENIKQAFGSGKVSFINADVAVASEVIRDIAKSCDAIVHFAALTGVRESLDRPLEYNYVNTIGTLNLLELCREFNIPKFLLASTGAVYGDQVPPYTEDMRPIPVSPYASSKVSAESYCLAYNDSFDISCSIVRFSNVFGPRKLLGPYANAIPAFVRSALTNQPITIYGDGNQQRDFVFVKDAVNACLKAINSTKAGIFNVASGKPTSVNELASTIEDILHITMKRNYTAARKGDAKVTVLSIEKAKRELSYYPAYSLKDGLAEYIEYQRYQDKK